MHSRSAHPVTQGSQCASSQVSGTVGRIDRAFAQGGRGKVGTIASPKISTPVSTGSEALVELLRELDTAKIHPLDIALKRPSLDDVFMSLTGHAAEEVKPELEVKGKKGGRP